MRPKLKYMKLTKAHVKCTKCIFKTQLRKHNYKELVLSNARALSIIFTSPFNPYNPYSK